MHFYKTMMVAVLALGIVRGTIPAQAATTYHRTKTVKVSQKAYYSTSKTGKAYNFSGSTRKFKLKANHALKNYTKTTWTRSAQTYVTKNGKKTLYYYVTNSNHKVKGWVYAKYLKAGKNYQATKATKTAKKAYYRAKSAKLASFTGSNSYTKLKNGAALKTNLTYNKTQQRYLYLNGKKTLYYYVTSADGKSKGWIKSSNLKAGRDYQMSSAKKIATKNYIMAKAGKAYTITGNNAAFKFSKGQDLNNKDNYTATQSRTIYLKNKAYTYYFVSNTTGSLNGWVASQYLKAGKHAPVTLPDNSNNSTASSSSSTSSSAPSSSVASSSSVTSSSVVSSSNSATSSSAASSSSSSIVTPTDPFAGKSEHALYVGTNTYLYKTSNLTDENIANTSLKQFTSIQVYPDGITPSGNFYAIPITINGEKYFVKDSFTNITSAELYPDGYYSSVGDTAYYGVVKPTTITFSKPVLEGSTWFYYSEAGYTIYIYENGAWRIQ